VVAKNAIFLDGERVGSIDAQGNFRVTGPDGRIHTGSVSALIASDLQGQLAGTSAGPSGRLRVHTTTYEVRGGRIFHEANQVGTVDEAGDFRINLKGASSTGNVRSTPGAVWLGLGHATASTRLKLGGHTLRAVNGVIYDQGVEVGWLTAEGRFRGVTRRGDHFEGSIVEPRQLTFLRFVADKR
jgi:hypothetical protein